jgi:phosphoenolpyruvate carboxykinase (ATP)
MNVDRMSRAAKCLEQLEKSGIKVSRIQHNLPPASLIEVAIRRREGMLSHTGALTVNTGKYTGRSPDDRFIVDDENTHNTVDWGKVNHSLSQDKYELIFERLKNHLDKREYFVFDGFVGADTKVRLPIRVLTDKAWQCLFATQIFVRPDANELQTFQPEFSLVSVNDFKANPELEGTKSETFIIINFTRKMIIIGSTSYAGEIKKAMFSVMSYLLPAKGIFPMHCSANVGKEGDAALFFGLSGTGKTTLSADKERYLVGDDEHGWSQNGIFNFEGGCYAKCINLKKENEPQIWNAIRFGAVMENVVVNQNTRVADFDNGGITENTRVVYPLEFIPNSIIPSLAPHPRVVIFLTADAFGVMPPISKLTREGGMYHFMSGYTSKLAGTERGITEPQETFSQCFGAPFMLLSAGRYAQMLGQKIISHDTKVYLINTGWFGGPYGVGKRINLNYTRSMVRAAISGLLEFESFEHHDIFNLDIPVACPGVPSEILNPANTWPDKEKYKTAARRLASLFVKNFEKFGDVPQQIKLAGPLL